MKSNKNNNSNLKIWSDFSHVIEYITGWRSHNDRNNPPWMFYAGANIGSWIIQ
jgi:hypothetical protein